MNAPLLAIVGPTCTGKTRVAVEAALRLEGAELINADSRQIRSGLSVGTCAPQADELRGVRAHLFGCCPPGQRFTVADWLALARPLVERMDATGITPVLVGGTGLYVRALLGGFALAPPPDPQRRAARDELASRSGGLASLVAELQRVDPAAAERVDVRNPRRVVRALERAEAGATSARACALPAVRVGLEVERAVHEGWILERSRRMFVDGSLVAEVRAALDRGVQPDNLSRCGIGYAEGIAVLEGRASVDDAVAAAARRTRRYAKAQRTFFRHEPGMLWLDAGEATPARLAAEAVAALARATS